MKHLIKVRFTEMMVSGDAVKTLRLLVVVAVLVSAFLFPEVAAAGPTPGSTGD